MAKSKYRLFGIINPIDALLVVGIVALVVSVYFFATSRETGGGTRVQFTIELQNRYEGFYQTITPGDIVIEGVRGLPLGTVVRAYSSPMLMDAADEANNIYRRSPVPGREFTYIVIEAYADISDYSTMVGQRSVRVNEGIAVRSKTFAGHGMITHLEFLP